jgi:hypothetical protein
MYLNNLAYWEISLSCVDWQRDVLPQVRLDVLYEGGRKLWDLLKIDGFNFHDNFCDKLLNNMNALQRRFQNLKSLWCIIGKSVQFAVFSPSKNIHHDMYVCYYMNVME